MPQRGTAYQPRVKPWGMAHNRCVLKERRIHPGALTCFAVAEYRGWRWGAVPRRGLRGTGSLNRFVVGAPRDQSCARRERWDRLGFRAAARRGSGCRRSYARSGPLPLPPRGQGRGRSHLFTKKGTLLTILMSLLGLRGTGPALAAASWKRRKALVGEAFGVPQRGTAYQPRVKPWGMAHNRSVLKERRIRPDSLACFAVAEPGLALGISASTESGGYRPVGLRGTSPATASGPGSVPPIYKKGDTLDYTDVVAGAPRDMFRCGLVVSKGLG